MSRHCPASSWQLAVLALALALGAGVACKLWTVRPIEDPLGETSAASGRQGAAADRFSAAAYAESIWASRVVPAAQTSAAALAPGSVAGAAPAGSTILVRGAGTVVRVNTQSRVGLALVDLAPGDGSPDVALQIGPVLRGTAVRDAMSFIRFGDFANQIEFADVANALNASVLQSVLSTIDVVSLEGRPVSFWGAMRVDGATGERLPEVVPIILQGGTP